MVLCGCVATYDYSIMDYILFVNRFFLFFYIFFKRFSMGIVDKVKLLCKESGITIKTLEQNTKISNGAVGKWDKSIPNVAPPQNNPKL